VAKQYEEGESKQARSESQKAWEEFESTGATETEK
jgi:hypothetical protein